MDYKVPFNVHESVFEAIGPNTHESVFETIGHNMEVDHWIDPTTTLGARVVQGRLYYNVYKYWLLDLTFRSAIAVINLLRVRSFAAHPGARLSFVGQQLAIVPAAGLKPTHVPNYTGLEVFFSTNSGEGIPCARFSAANGWLAKSFFSIRRDGPNRLVIMASHNVFSSICAFNSPIRLHNRLFQFSRRAFQWFSPTAPIPRIRLIGVIKLTRSIYQIAEQLMQQTYGTPLMQYSHQMGQPLTLADIFCSFLFQSISWLPCLLADSFFFLKSLASFVGRSLFRSLFDVTQNNVRVAYSKSPVSEVEDPEEDPGTTAPFSPPEESTLRRATPLPDDNEDDSYEPDHIQNASAVLFSAYTSRGTGGPIVIFSSSTHCGPNPTTTFIQCPFAKNACLHHSIAKAASQFGLFYNSPVGHAPHAVTLFAQRVTVSPALHRSYQLSCIQSIFQTVPYIEEVLSHLKLHSRFKNLFDEYPSCFPSTACLDGFEFARASNNQSTSVHSIEESANLYATSAAASFTNTRTALEIVDVTVFSKHSPIDFNLLRVTFSLLLMAFAIASGDIFWDTGHVSRSSQISPLPLQGCHLTAQLMEHVWEVRLVCRVDAGKMGSSCLLIVRHAASLESQLTQL